MSDPLLVRALRREQVERPPVWFMRQAGRSLPEYRALRERHSFFEVANTPELCAEVTLQPVRRYGVDAAVLFADIVTPVLGMGIDVELVEGVGPVVAEPIAAAADVDRMQVPDMRAAFSHVVEAVAIVRQELEPERALVGFCGGPFTVAGYLVEGKPSRDFARAKALMYREPAVWHRLMDKLTDTFAGYLLEQVSAGADAIQLFDSWVGVLSVTDYEEFVAPYSRRFSSPCAPRPSTSGPDGSPARRDGRGRRRLHRIGLARPARRGLGRGRRGAGVQGNLDPAVLLGPWPRIEAAARDVLARAGGRAGHVFNLGHGVLRRTDPDDLTRLVELGATDKQAVVLMAYGSPDRIEDVPAYYADIRGGGPVRPELLADLTERYRRLGIEESNPLNEITERTRAALEAELGLPVFTGMKHWRPRIADAAEAALGRPRYRRRPRPGAPLLAPVDRRLPAAARGRARRARRARVRRQLAPGAGLRRAPRRPGAGHVGARGLHGSFPAGSHPGRGRPVPGPAHGDQPSHRAAAALRDWSFSFQSASPTGEPWLGPDIIDHLEALHARGVDDVLVCPIGFVADHLEIRWDLDTQAHQKADELGMRLARIGMPNDDPAFVATLASIVRRVLAVPSNG